jgi:class 3 adenylate cyclase
MMIRATHGAAAIHSGRAAPATAAMLACLLMAGSAMAQSAAPVPHIPGMAMPAAEPTPPPFYRELTFHVLIGLIAATAGVLAHRAWSRRRWRRPPAGVMQEAVLVVDLVASTQLATHHGGSLAMRARNLLEERTLAAARRQGVVFVENTGDGCMMTFPSVAAALQSAVALLRDLRDRPPDLAPGPHLDVRAGVAYGEILLDSRGGRHGAAINKAFRLMGVPSDAFVGVEGEERLKEIPERNRIFVDEEAANESASGDVALRQVGVCRLKGFTGFHRVYELPWNGT